ncbi:cell envelope integrity protein CreD [Spirochaeta cellobiosiphila]|uniref:cell envelope integrity protein CreD n=1 Tax=Spirochaeta cellobiosiphila TaxID=504483 RepID=UPI0003F92DAC|nr:cell envelope integrity protein CreD [Spirochaeta cellobiosiphila]
MTIEDKTKKHLGLLIKASILLVLALLILIPIYNVKRLLREREERASRTTSQVINQWGGRQYIMGPVLAVPFRFTRDIEEDKKIVTKIYKGVKYFLPSELVLDTDTESVERHKGIFTIPLYKSQLGIHGHFDKLSFQENRGDNLQILWDQAKINIEVASTIGLSQTLKLQWNGSTTEFFRDLSGNDIMSDPLGAPLGANPREGGDFSIDLNLKGGESLEFYPLGKEVKLSLNSDWSSPQFTGTFLPDDYVINEKGTTASWSMGAYNVNFPQSWYAGDIDKNLVYESRFGVEFTEVIDQYFQVHRALKYAFLFVFMPFIALFLMEIIFKHPLHTVQYLFIGLGTAFFFLLLLTLSEHLDFWLSYGLSGLGTSLLIYFYGRAILPNQASQLSLLGLLILLYAYLFLSLQSEDYALLIGSLGLFGLFSAVMIGTRKLDWNEVGMYAQPHKRKDETEEEE